MFKKSANDIIFADSNLEKAFNSLVDDSPLKKSVKKAIDKIKENVFCGERIKKELIPHEYIKKYKIDNLLWYPLTKGWRLVYSIIAPSNIEILAVIIEYYNHKDYERRFGY